MTRPRSSHSRMIFSRHRHGTLGADRPGQCCGTGAAGGVTGLAAGSLRSRPCCHCCGCVGLDGARHHQVCAEDPPVRWERDRLKMPKRHVAKIFPTGTQISAASRFRYSGPAHHPLPVANVQAEDRVAGGLLQEKGRRCRWWDGHRAPSSRTMVGQLWRVFCKMTPEGQFQRLDILLRGCCAA